MKAVNATDDTFDSLVSQHGFVLVMFYWPTLPGYGKLRKAYHEGAAAFGDRLQFVKVNIKKCPRLSVRYKVIGFPEFWLYKDGERIADNIGSFPFLERVDSTEHTRRHVIEWLEKHMGLAEPR